jgi:hypothetical protein
MKKLQTGNVRNNFMKLLTVYFLVLVAILINVTGCGSNPIEQPNTSNWECPQAIGDMKNLNFADSGLASIEKQGIFGECVPESTPVVFNNQLLMVSFNQGHGDTSWSTIIRDYNTRQIVKVVLWNLGYMGFGSAIVVNNTMYLFSSTGLGITMMKSSDLNNWTKPISVLAPLAGNPYYNTSVAPAENGFVMAYEVGGGDGYQWQVATSPDLVNWTRVGQQFTLESYAACPTVRYVNGYYQFIYLAMAPSIEGPNGMVSKVARTKDFITYEIAPRVLIAPTHDKTNEGKNTSDVDLVEFNGKVYLNYINGNQSGWGSQMWATYNGTIEDLFTEIWE